MSLVQSIPFNRSHKTSKSRVTLIFQAENNNTMNCLASFLVKPTKGSAIFTHTEIAIEDGNTYFIYSSKTKYNVSCVTFTENQIDRHRTKCEENPSGEYVKTFKQSNIVESLDLKCTLEQKKQLKSILDDLVGTKFSSSAVIGNAILQALCCCLFPLSAALWNINDVDWDVSKPTNFSCTQLITYSLHRSGILKLPMRCKHWNYAGSSLQFVQSQDLLNYIEDPSNNVSATQGMVPGLIIDSYSNRESV